MLPTFRYTESLHSHVRAMREGAAMTLEMVEPSSDGYARTAAFAVWLGLARATTLLHDVRMLDLGGPDCS